MVPRAGNQLIRIQVVPFTPVRKYLTGYGDVFDSLVFFGHIMIS